MLTLLAQSESPLTSEAIANTAGVTAVTIRRLFNRLLRAGLLKSTVGSKGGVVLARKPTDITLRDVFMALNGAHIFGSQLGDGQPHCEEGYRFNVVLTSLLKAPEHELGRALSKISIASLLTSDLLGKDGKFGFEITKLAGK